MISPKDSRLHSDRLVKGKGMKERSRYRGQRISVLFPSPSVQFYTFCRVGKVIGSPVAEHRVPTTLLNGIFCYSRPQTPFQRSRWIKQIAGAAGTEFNSRGTTRWVSILSPPFISRNFIHSPTTHPFILLTLVNLRTTDSAINSLLIRPDVAFFLSLSRYPSSSTFFFPPLISRNYETSYTHAYLHLSTQINETSERKLFLLDVRTATEAYIGRILYSLELIPSFNLSYFLQNFAITHGSNSSK